MSKFLLVLGLIIFGLLTPAAALACGGMVSPQGSNVQPQSLRAVVIFDPATQGQNGRERLVVQLDYRVNQGKVQNFGWVMAVPGKPEVAAAPDELFSRLVNATVPKKNYLDKLFGVITSDGFKGTAAGSRASAPGGGVQVVSQTRVGAFDVTVVSATEQAALSKWAADNAYTTPLLDTEAIKDYIKAGWFFVLSKLAPTEATPNASGPQAGKSQPVVLSFETTEPIYPWRLSAYGPDGKLAVNRVLPAEIYLLQPAAKLEPKNNGSTLLLDYAEQLDPTTSTDLLKGLAGNNNLNYYLTAYNGSVGATALQTSDLTLKRADSQTEFNSGKLDGVQWVWAALGTLFYGQIALLLTLWVLFTSDLVGVIAGLVLLGLIAAFVIPRRPRPIALIVLAAINFMLGLGMVLGGLDVTPLVLISLLPLAGLLIWAIRSAYVKLKPKNI
jgi:hypothetical protein